MNIRDHRSQQPQSNANSYERSLIGHTAVITGAAKGIGRACALFLAQAGANILVHYRSSAQDAHNVIELCRSLGVQAHPFQADISNPLEVDRLTRFALDTFGSVQMLVNNAGISYTNLLIDTTYEQWEQIIQTNLTGPFLLTKSLLPSMIQQSYGRIVNISSIWGITGGSCEVAYSTSKGGLIAFTKALAKEMARAGITVNAVAPGAIETDMIDNLSSEEKLELAEDTPVGRLGTVEDVAHVVRFLCLPSSAFMTGQILSPNGGLVT
jgi:3-oxoacyl-[acyl-carrier protein] reductase